MHLILILLSILFASTNCLAEPEEELKEYEVMQSNLRNDAIRHIPKLIKQYATTIGCNFRFNRNNVVPYRIDGEDVYVALYDLDIGCNGGTAMSATSLVVLRWGGSHPQLYLSPQMSKLIGEFPATIDKLFIKNDQLWYSALWLKPKDALCCPSERELGRLTYRNGEWHKAK